MLMRSLKSGYMSQLLAMSPAVMEPILCLSSAFIPGDNKTESAQSQPVSYSEENYIKFDGKPHLNDICKHVFNRGRSFCFQGNKLSLRHSHIRMERKGKGSIKCTMGMNVCSNVHEKYNCKNCLVINGDKFYIPHSLNCVVT